MASRKEFDRRIEHDDLGQQHDDQEKRGVIGSVMKAVQDTYENAREAVAGKRDPADHSDYTATTEVVHHVVGDENAVLSAGEVRDISADKSRGVYDSKAGEYADHAGQKAKETKDATKEKTMEYADYVGEKAKEAKDRTMEKAGEYKDYTAEKEKEGKDSAADAAKSAIGCLGEKEEETKQKAAETTEAAKQKTAEAKDKTKEMVSGEEDEEARRRMEGVKVEDRGGLGEKTWGRGNAGVIKAGETRTGAVAEKLKAADQMTGQTFNDVGPMDDYGITRVGLLETKK